MKGENMKFNYSDNFKDVPDEVCASLQNLRKV